MEKIENYLETGRFPDGGSWFKESFVKDDGSFIDSEGEVWDFKEDWPFSYSDKYFIHLCKLAISFANTSGGLIIFGINDKDRKAKKRIVRPNMDKFVSAFQNISDNTPKMKLIQPNVENDVEVDVIAVFPNKVSATPSAFRKDFAEKNELERFWVRIGHETVAARSKHIPIIFCGAARRTFDRKPLESSLPPNPSTIRQFVGRMEPFADIFAWIGDANEPRIFLYGRGGSGKTTIAYEVASCIAGYGGSIDIGGDSFDIVIFVSAKEIELNTGDSSVRAFIGKDFTDTSSLLTSILVLGSIPLKQV